MKKISITLILTLCILSSLFAQPDSIQTLYGVSRSIAVSGNWAISGPWYQGVEFLYNNGGVWQNMQQEFSPNPSSFGQHGNAVAISSDFAFAGDINYDNYEYEDIGAVYIYQNVDGTWEQTQFITPENPFNDSNFGSQLAVVGDYLFVSSFNKSNVEIYYNNSGTWEHNTTITKSGKFGHSLAT